MTNHNKKKKNEYLKGFSSSLRRDAFHFTQNCTNWICFCHFLFIFTISFVLFHSFCFLIHILIKCHAWILRFCCCFTLPFHWNYEQRANLIHLTLLLWHNILYFVFLLLFCLRGAWKRFLPAITVLYVCLWENCVHEMIIKFRFSHFFFEHYFIFSSENTQKQWRTNTRNCLCSLVNHLSVTFVLTATACVEHQIQRRSNPIDLLEYSGKYFGRFLKMLLRHDHHCNKS